MHIELKRLLELTKAHDLLVIIYPTLTEHPQSSEVRFTVAVVDIDDFVHVTTQNTNLSFACSAAIGVLEDMIRRGAFA